LWGQILAKVCIVRDTEDGQGLISGSNYQAYGAHGERGVRTYNGGLGAPPPAGSRGRALGRGGGEHPEAESLSAFKRAMKAAKFTPLMCVAN